MENDRYARYAAATGIVAVVLIVLGFGIFASDAPKLDDPALDWQTFFRDHQDRIQTGLAIVSIGLFFFIWFVGTLRSAIAAVEPGTGRLASIAFGGGLIAAAFFLLAVSGAAAAALHPQGVPPAVTRALNDFGTMAGVPAAAGFTALFAATAIAGYRHGALAAPVAGIAALAAITQPLTYASVATDSGAFAADGAVCFWVPFIGFIVGILTISGALASAAGRGAGAGRATPAAG